MRSSKGEEVIDSPTYCCSNNLLTKKLAIYDKLNETPKFRCRIIPRNHS